MDNQQNADGFRWVWRDPGHLDAHRNEFFRPVESVLEELRPLVTPQRPAARVPAGAPATGQAVDPEGKAWLHADYVLSEAVGLSGLRQVPPDGSQSFWAYRRGRAVPSHLCLGERQSTRRVCLWGWWEADSFVIHTIYPGTVAPREIHDPEIDTRDLPSAIEFWRRHAIITREGDYADIPCRADAFVGV